MPLYFQAVKGSSIILSGVDFLPATLTVAPAAVVVGAVIGKVGSYRWAIWAGWSLSTLGYGLQQLLDVHTSTAAWVLITLVTGVGTGMLYPSLTFAIQAATPNKDQAYSVSLFTFFRVSSSKPPCRKLELLQPARLLQKLIFSCLGCWTRSRRRRQWHNLPEFHETADPEAFLDSRARFRVVRRLNCSRGNHQGHASFAGKGGAYTELCRCTESDMGRDVRSFWHRPDHQLVDRALRPE